MNALIKAPNVSPMQGQWVWDGSTWVCDDGSGGTPFPCPPPGFPPAGCPPWFPPPQGQPPWYPGANAGVSFSQTAPINPTRGHFWWNGSKLQMFDGAAWVVIGGSGAINGGGGGTDGTSGAGTVVISTTPPGNPATGSQWWNGSILQMWDGTKWVQIGPGQAAGPVPTTTQVWAMGQVTDLTVTASVWSVIPYIDQPLVDSSLGWDSVTKRFNPKKAGVYNFMCRGIGQPTQGLALLKNDPGTFDNTLKTANVVAIAAETGGGWMNITGMTLMNGTTDFVRVWGYSSTASWPSVGSSAAFTAWLMP